MDAYKFGTQLGAAAQQEKNAGVFSSLFGGATKAAPAARAAVGSATRAVANVAPRLNPATAHPSVLGPLLHARGERLMNHPELINKAWEWGQRAVKRPMVPPANRLRMPGVSTQLVSRFGETPAAQAALANATSRFEQVAAQAGKLRGTRSPRSPAHIISELTSFGQNVPTAAKTWGELKGIVPAAMKQASVLSAFELLACVRLD